MLPMYTDFMPITEETELGFWRRKAQDRADFIAEQKATITKLRAALADMAGDPYDECAYCGASQLSEICEEVTT